MARTMLGVLAALVVLVGGFLGSGRAADEKKGGKLTEATVVSYEKGKVVVKVGDKEKTIEIKGGTPHVHGADGKQLKGKDIEAALKKDVKVDLEEEDGKVVEIHVKK